MKQYKNKENDNSQATKEDMKFQVSSHILYEIPMTAALPLTL